MASNRKTMKPQKATMTLNLSVAEMEAVEEMAAQQELSKTALIRQALRTYHLVKQRQRDGYEMAWRKDGVVTGTILELLPMCFRVTEVRPTRKKRSK